MATSPTPAILDRTRRALDRRVGATTVVADLADEVVAATEGLADRCARGGRLLVLADRPHDADARHIAVEFLHPVIVGKRAVPAVALASGHLVPVAPSPVDALVAVVGPARDPSVADALAVGRELGLLTVALVAGPAGGWADVADHTLALAAGDDDVAAEVMVTLYHVLWEMTHAFLDGTPTPVAADTGAVAHDDTAPPAREPDGTRTSAIAGLYPFLYGGAGSQGHLRDEVARSVRDKATDADRLRRRVAEDAGSLAAVAVAVADSLVAGGRLFAFGNGGSSTDAGALVASMGRHTTTQRPLPAFDLTSDTATLTALTNDVSFDVVFARQVQALGRAGDVAVGLSTSGGSANVVAGLAQAADMGMTTVALAGYDGGALAEADFLEHLLVVPSSSVHRIQEVQATLYRALVEVVAGA